MGVERLSSKAGGDLSSIAAVLLTFLGLLTHWAWEHREEAKGRFCGIALVAVALILSFLRAAQASFDGASDKGVFFLFCFSLSTGAPITAAWGLTSFWPPLRQFLTSLVDLFSAFAVLQKEKSEVAEQEARVANADNRIEAVLGRFTEAYEEAVFGAERRWEQAQATRRTEDANLAKSEIHFEFARNRKPVRDYFQWVVVALVALLFLWGLGAHADPGGQEPVWSVVVCDRSSSTGGRACSTDTIASELAAWSEKAVLSHKGSFRIFIVGKDIGDVDGFLTIEAPQKIPAPLNRGRASWKKTVLAELKSTPLPNKAGAASAIVDAIYKASLSLSGLKGTKSLTVISDFREYSHGGRVDFEHRVPSPEEFVDYLRKVARPPDLSGVAVVACGFQASSPAGGRLDVAALLKVQDAWKAAFEYWGHPTPILEECSFD